MCPNSSKHTNAIHKKTRQALKQTITINNNNDNSSRGEAETSKIHISYNLLSDKRKGEGRTMPARTRPPHIYYHPRPPCSSPFPPQ